jgi:NADH-quinone oxidoreductase subunit C
LSADDTSTTDTATAPEVDDAADAAEAAPTDDAREAILAALAAELGDALLESHVRAGHGLWVRVQRDAWRTAAEAAKAAGCTFFDFLSAMDWMPSPYGRYEDAVVDVGMPQRNPTADSYATGLAGGDARFQLLCHLVDVRSRHAGVFLRADLPDDDLRAPSIQPVYSGAGWHERECWEMFGITFDGHPGLTHLYLPGEFEGHPLRKDFPLIARIVKPWPGIVDVEPMPGEPAGAEDDAEATDAEGGDD